MPYPLGRHVLRSGSLRRVAVILRQSHDGPSPLHSPHRSVFESALRTVRETGATPVIEHRALPIGESNKDLGPLAVLNDGMGRDTGDRFVDPHSFYYYYYYFH